jgi:polysaccharide biosynthesis/export protein
MMKTCTQQSVSLFPRVLAIFFMATIVLTFARGQGSGQVTEPLTLAPSEQSVGVGDGAAPGVVISPGRDYRIGAGDVIDIQVNLAPEISTLSRVNSDGTILMPVIGRIRAQQKTSEELSEEIAAGLKGSYLKNPIVKVAIKHIYSSTYLIQGAVRQPGVYQVEGQPTLLELLTLSGGLADNHGTTAFIIRRIKTKPSAPALPTSGLVAPEEPSEPAESTASSSLPAASPSYEVLKANIAGLFKGNFEQNSPLEPGDIVNIPTSDFFFITGEVRTPGSYSFKDGTTLRQAISMAQGMTPNAVSSRVMIFRENERGQSYELKVNLNDVLRGKAKDLPLMVNDVLVVPNNTFKSSVLPVLSAFGSGFSFALGGRL